MLDFYSLLDNISAVYEDASEEEVQNGKQWYHVAHRFAAGLARLHDGDTGRAAGVIAALSPQVSWERNMSMATSVYREQPVIGQTGINIEKAKRIYEGEDPLEVLGGKKTRAFYTNISFPDNSGVVTIDRHAVAIALGERDINREHSNLLRRKGNYEELERAYKTAGFRYFLKGSEIQAVTWLVWRDRHGEFFEDTSTWS
jgi:hypothetical protein